MKEKSKKLFALSLALVLCLSSVNITYAQENAGSETESATIDENHSYEEADNISSEEASDYENNSKVEDESEQKVEGTVLPDDSDMEKTEDSLETEQTTESISENAEGSAEVSEDGHEDVATNDVLPVANTQNGISYEVHVQNIGWQPPVSNGAMAGTQNQKRQVEALKVSLNGIDGNIVYRAHVQNIGWQTPVSNGGIAGTTGNGWRVEAVQMYLTGAAAEKYDVYYSTHIQNYGWLKWTKGANDDSGISGSTGLNLRVEAIKIQLVEKGQPAPDDIAGCASYSYITKYSFGDIVYSGHQQNEGDLADVYDGATLGVVGKSERLEAIKVEKGSDLQKIDGEIKYRVHGQNYGTQGWVDSSSGKIAGTTGQSRHIEAVQMYLTGALADQYDIYYRVHVRNIGWMKWTKGTEGESGWSGTSGYGLRCEAIQIRLLKKGESAPTDSAKYSYLSENDIPSVSYSGHQQGYGNLNAVTNGSTLGHTGESLRLEAVNISLQKNKGAQITGGVQYRVHVQNDGWQSWVTDGKLAGTTGKSKRLEAIQIKLTGEIANFCDVWYRVHTEEYGWLGWAKNGQTAGTSGISYRIEAIQIKIIPGCQPAPGANSGYYKDTPKMSAVDQRIYNYCQSVYNSVGRDLRSCYNWVVNNMSYQSLGVPSLPSGYTSRSQWYAIKAFSEHRGNCYCYAAAFYYLAKNLGYNAEYVEGRVTAVGGGYTPHGWVVINGAYICDPEAQDEIGRYNFYMQPIGSPVLSYIR